MQLQLWARRAVVGSLVLWVVVVTTYIVLGFVRHAVLPSPYNVMIMLILSNITLAAGGAWIGGRLEVRLGRIEGAYIAAADRGEFAEKRLNAHLLAISRRLDDLEAPTVPITRTLYAVGVASVGAAPTELPPDNVVAFELGRKAERARYQNSGD